MLANSRRALRLTALAGCAVLALSGCGGGSVSVRSNFSGAALATPGALGPSTAVSSPPGLTAHYSGSGNLGLALLGIVIVADLVQWTSTMLKQAFGVEASPETQGIHHGTILPTPKKCVYPVPEMC